MIAREELLRAILRQTNRQVRALDIELREGAVALRGTAPTFYAKQLAQEAVRKMLPNTAIENAIVVFRQPLAPALAS